MSTSVCPSVVAPPSLCLSLHPSLVHGQLQTPGCGLDPCLGDVSPPFQIIPLPPPHLTALRPDSIIQCCIYNILQLAFSLLLLSFLLCPLAAVHRLLVFHMKHASHRDRLDLKLFILSTSRGVKIQLTIERCRAPLEPGIL